jgi:pimeloyl-ACP methyl ester carboxylesterase
MAALLDRIGITRAHVFGFSDGGEVAILMAVERPDLVRSIAAWGAVGYFGEEMRPRIQRTYPPDWADAETRARNGGDAFQGVVLGWVNGMKAYIDAGGSVSRHQADRIVCPVLLMLGDGDSLNPIPVGQALADQIPAGQLAIFENCGHAVHRENPDAFRSAVDDFLQAVD